MVSVARGTLINLASRLASVGLLLAITAFTARLGTATQGAFALFTSVEGVLLALLSGFGVALARRVSHHCERPAALTGAVVVAGLAAGGIAGAAIALFSAFGPEAYRALWLLALAAPVLLLAPNLAGLWLGRGTMLPMAAISLAPPLLTLAGLAVLAWATRPSLEQVLLAWIAAKVIVGLAVVGVLWRRGGLAKPDFGALRGEARFIAVIGLTNLIGLLNYRVGLFVVERLLGLSATGVYSIAVMVAELAWFVSGSLTQAAYGRIGTPDPARAAATTLRAVKWGLASVALTAPLLWAGASVLVPWVLGETYRASLPVLAVLLPGVVIFGAASPLSAYFTNHAGRPQVPAQVAALSLLLNGLLAVLLVPHWGMTGAAVASSVSYAAAVVVLGWRFAAHVRASAVASRPVS